MNKKQALPRRRRVCAAVTWTIWNFYLHYSLKIRSGQLKTGDYVQRLSPFSISEGHSSCLSGLNTVTSSQVSGEGMSPPSPRTSSHVIQISCELSGQCVNVQILRACLKAASQIRNSDPGVVVFFFFFLSPFSMHVLTCVGKYKDGKCKKQKKITKKWPKTKQKKQPPNSFFPLSVKRYVLLKLLTAARSGSYSLLTEEAL